MTSESGIIVRMKHCRAAGVCASGARYWFDKQKLDFRAFLRDGIAVEVIEATGDSVAARVAVCAREEAGDGR